MEIIKARLRKGKDDDIKEGLKNLPAHYDHSDFIRDAVRLMLFGEIKRRAYRDENLNNTEEGDDLDLVETETSEDELESNLDQFLKDI